MSEYECREVAVASLYNWTQWLELDEGERAMCVAHCRVHHAIDANVQQAYTRYSERQARKRHR